MFLPLHPSCRYDFFDTYVAQYRRAFALSNATGVMCRCHPLHRLLRARCQCFPIAFCACFSSRADSYNAENGHPSCANDFLLNTAHAPALHVL